MRIHRLILLGTLLLLSACGFHLRGAGGGAQFPITELKLVSRDVYGETQKLMRDTLKSYKVKISDTAAYTLNLTREEMKKRAASQTSSSRTADYELINKIDFQIQDRKGLILFTDQAEVRKTYVHDSNNLISSDQEAGLVRQELRSEVIQQLFMRLQRITPQDLEKLQAQADAKAKAEAEALEQALRAEQEEANRPKASPILPPTQ